MSPRVDVSVVTSGHDVADARLHREVAAFQRAGFSVEVLGLGDAAGAPAGVRTVVSRRGSPAARMLLAFRYAVAARGRAVLTLDPDSAVAVAVVRRGLRWRRRGSVVVADVHEDYEALLDDRAWARGFAGRLARVVARAGTSVAAGADLTVVADEHVPPARANDRLVLRNLPDLAMLPLPSAPGPTPTALYIGDARTSRGLFDMVEAVLAAPPWRLIVVGPLNDADRARVTSLAASAGAAERIELPGRLAPATAWTRAEGAWLGFALLHATPAFVESVPSKLYEYLAAGLPVVVTDLPRQVELVTTAGAGVVVRPGDPSAVAEHLRAWARDPSELLELRARAQVWSAAQRGTDPYAVLPERVRAHLR